MYLFKQLGYCNNTSRNWVFVAVHLLLGNSLLSNLQFHGSLHEGLKKVDNLSNNLRGTLFCTASQNPRRVQHNSPTHSLVCLHWLFQLLVLTALFMPLVIRCFLFVVTMH
jgi:hypothetical protein